MVPEQVCDYFYLIGISDANCLSRRAKIKALAKKSLETGEDFDAIPESMRTYLAMQAMESGKGLGAGLLGRGFMPYGHGGMPFGGDQNGQGKVCKSKAQNNSLLWLCP